MSTMKSSNSIILVATFGPKIHLSYAKTMPYGTISREHPVKRGERTERERYESVAERSAAADEWAVKRFGFGSAASLC